MVELRFGQNILFRRCLAQLIVPWKSDSRLKKIGSYLGKATLNLGKLDLGLVSAGSNGNEPSPVFAHKKVIICLLCLLSIPCEVLSFIGPRKM